jgi:hypothetical protein
MNAAVFFSKSEIGGTCSPLHHRGREVACQRMFVRECAGGRVDVDHRHETLPGRIMMVVI